MLDEESRRSLEGILNNKVFKQVLDVINDGFVGGWKKAESPEQREAFWHRVTAISQITKEMERLARPKRIPNNKRSIKA